MDASKKIPLVSYSLLALVGLIATGISLFLYNYTTRLLEDRLKERLVAMASTAALQFDPKELAQIVDETDVGNPAFLKLTRNLQEIRNANENVHYAYILRPTAEAGIFEFVVDADSIDPYAEVDLNKDGVIDESDALNIPGDDYDVSELPELKVDALKFPTTDSVPYTADAWGTFLSGYAPIKKAGETVAVLALDVEVSDYYLLVRQTFIPFILFIGVLLLLLTFMTVIIVKMWKFRVDFVQELDRQKDELLSIVSHQLATPVSSIKWYTEMLIDGDLGKVSKQQKEHLGSMANVAGNLSDLVSMILDVSRIQLGRMHIEKQELDLDGFFKEILEIINPKAEQKKVKFDVSMPKKLPKAMLDRRYTHMTIENLLSNAIKYTPENGSVNFNVELRGNILYCEVKDTGVGIPKADQEKIFGKMFRATNVRNEIDGNGFGLYVAKGAVEAQGGKIWFKSTEGKGTTFFVELPLRDLK